MTTANPTNSLAVEDLGSAAQRDRRKRILDATIALASQGGFDAVQMRAVAEKADVALGTLYRYFPKIHLLVSALHREFERTETEAARQARRGRHHRGPGHHRPQANHPRHAERRPAHRGPHPRLHVRRRLRRRRDPPGRHAAHLDADPRDVPEGHEVTDEDVQIARVIGDVWLSALVGWVTGRNSAAETGQQIEDRGPAAPAATDAGFRQS